MSQIKSKNTKPERLLRVILRDMDFKYKLGSKLPGRPDIKINGQKTVIFVDGCFWHACPWHYKLPSSNTPFWLDKMSKNRKRDARNRRILRKMGYKVIRVWEHELGNPVKLSNKLNMDLRDPINAERESA